jgi:hypothetical protein
MPALSIRRETSRAGETRSTEKAGVRAERAVPVVQPTLDVVASDSILGAADLGAFAAAPLTGRGHQRESTRLGIL